MAQPFRIFAVVLLTTWLAGCGLLPRGPAGSFETIAADADATARIAADAARQMAVELPPAQTVIAVHAVSEKSTFAPTLVEQLRLQGFGVELCANPCLPKSATATLLNYVAANIGTQGYRLALSWAGVVITRAYVQTPDGLQYAGLWTRGELAQ